MEENARLTIPRSSTETRLIINDVVGRGNERVLCLTPVEELL